VVASLEGAAQGGYFVDEAAGGPDVGLLVVFAVAHLFGRHVVGCAHVRLRELGVLAHFAAESEVTQLDVVGLVDEDVGRLDVAVQHLPAPPALVRSPRVAVLERQQQLVADLPDHLLLDGRLRLLGLAQLSAQISPRAVLHDDVDLGGGLVDHPVHVPYDIGMVQLLQQVHLRHQLLLLAAAHLLEVDLLPHEHLAALLLTHLPHHSERPLPDLLQGCVLLHSNLKLTDCQSHYNILLNSVCKPAPLWFWSML
jgi:hypothetical protein